MLRRVALVRNEPHGVTSQKTSLNIHKQIHITTTNDTYHTRQRNYWVNLLKQNTKLLIELTGSLHRMNTSNEICNAWDLPFIQAQITSKHFTSLHFTSLHFISPHLTSLHMGIRSKRWLVFVTKRLITLSTTGDAVCGSRCRRMVSGHQKHICNHFRWQIFSSG
jgi:hypothetical protein